MLRLMSCGRRGNIKEKGKTLRRTELFAAELYRDFTVISNNSTRATHSGKSPNSKPQQTDSQNNNKSANAFKVKPKPPPIHMKINTFIWSIFPPEAGLQH
ncbi:Protein of unknown function [Cotesia congregata]|uniref:Uncharacterized protein n=1 Tax=Cotesia congregata TaxID=51543 RepID=A0A8J2HBX2_COTCN|nr:Protein of unknown function [Cotesia congregata]